MELADRLGDARLVRRAGRWAALLFWAIQFTELTIVTLTEESGLARQLLLPRTVVMGVGLLLTLPIIETAARTGHRPFRFRLLATLGAALCVCALIVVTNFFAFHYLIPQRPDEDFNLTDFVYVGFGWTWFFLGIGGALVGLSFSLEIRDRERRLAAMEVVARDARLAALRHQLNPHFLFNTLNSVAALIDGDDKKAAEEMVLGLADFLRATLDMEPVEDIDLQTEIELQTAYLAIEQVRFQHRLRVEMDIAPDTLQARVPGLILQPLVENAVVHGVARTDRPVEIRLVSRRVGDMLQVSVRNDVFGTPRPGGSGVGLSNVRSRLEGRFGGRHTFTAAGNGDAFEVVIEFPLAQEQWPTRGSRRESGKGPASTRTITGSAASAVRQTLRAWR